MTAPVDVVPIDPSVDEATTRLALLLVPVATLDIPELTGFDATGTPWLDLPRPCDHLVSYRVSTTPPGNVRVSTRRRFTQLSSAAKNGVPPPTSTG